MTLAKTPLCLLAALAAGAWTPHARPAQADDDPAVQRGQHLVRDVAMCVQCHTPRDEDGALIAEQLLGGAAVPIRPPEWAEKGRGWAFRAPHIAGLPGYSDEQAVRLLTTGVAADGSRTRAPMPPFRLTDAEARAVVAYLRSLD